MASFGSCKTELESHDPLYGAVDEYPEIHHYVNHFQVDLANPDVSTTGRHLKDLIVIFKKKRLPRQSLAKNIYHHGDVELDALDLTKSKSSCLRCRKFKKRCTRALPECGNCLSCDEMCIYLPRKRKPEHNSSETTSVSVQTRLKALPRRRFSVPVTFHTAPSPREWKSSGPEMPYDLRHILTPQDAPPIKEEQPESPNYHYASSVYKLLN